MHHHCTAEIVFGLFLVFLTCLSMDGWVVVMSMNTLTHDYDVSFLLDASMISFVW
jgi:hypothetical protein